MTKDEIRNQVWELLEKEGAARFPGTRGRIPNFVGAEKAASLAQTLDVWKVARAIKVNPDSPQMSVRKLALKEGKVVYMAVPRLREEKCFIELDPAKLRSHLTEAASIKGAVKYGRPIFIEEMEPIDLIVCGSVAVTRDGARVGKGGGYSDLEFALATQFGKVSPTTPILTTVHPLQVVSFPIPVLVHDIPVDFIVTPDEIIATKTSYPRPTGIYWDLLPEEKIREIPVLGKERFQKVSF